MGRPDAGCLGFWTSASGLTVEHGLSVAAARQRHGNPCFNASGYAALTGATLDMSQATTGSSSISPAAVLLIGM